MKLSKDKTKAATIVLVLLLTIAATLVTLPTASAQAGSQKTYAFIGAVPNPVGKGQEVLLHVGITQQLALVQYGYEGLTVTVTKPDNTTETLGPIRTDSTGGTGYVYVPDQVGTYYLQTHFPEQRYPATLGNIPEGTVMLASDSEKLALIVQKEPIPYHPGFPLPTEYWTRPIDAQLREWSSIAGNWLGYNRYSGPFVPYNDGPETGHVLWAKPLTIGGLVGGELDDHAFEVGDAYEGKWAGSIIIAGKLYYQAGAYDLPRLYHCVDLHTGEELWAKTFLDNRSIAFGQLFYWDSYNYHGVFPYLWVTVGTTWHAFDPFTGEWRFTINNVPSGVTMKGPKGEIYRLSVDLTKGYMTLWNMSALISWEGSWGSAAHLKTHNATANTAEAKRAWSWNETIQTGLPGGLRLEHGSAWTSAPPSGIPMGDRIIGGSVTTKAVTVWALSLKPGQEGHLLFNTTWNAPAEWAEGNVDVGWVISSLEDKVGVVWLKETRQYYGFSLETGEFLWKTESEHYMNQYASSRCAIAYGRLFTVGYSGIAYCYNVTTGHLEWTYAARDPYKEILWSNNWPLYLGFITDGKIYLHHTEHSPTDPYPRGSPFVCLDVETGELVFEANMKGSHWGESPIIGDSIIAMYNTYDDRVYAIGKGESATEVSASPKIVANGDSVLIEGTVTDQSPGAKGTPAISDKSMKAWMEYLYMQHPIPTNATGVPVELRAMRSDGSIIEIGTVTSDIMGHFEYMWTPPTTDTYKILATFAGSKSYWMSSAETALGVGPAPAEPEPVEIPAYPDYTPLFAGMIVAIVIAIIIGIVSILDHRRLRK